MKFDHVAIKVNDIDETVSWYQENLGGNVLYQDKTWGLMSINNVKVAFVLEDMHPPHLCFEVSKEKKNELELKYESFGSHRDGSEYLYLKDNADNVVEFLYWPKIQ